MAEGSSLSCGQLLMQRLLTAKNTAECSPLNRNLYCYLPEGSRNITEEEEKGLESKSLGSVMLPSGHAVAIVLIIAAKSLHQRIPEEYVYMLKPTKSVNMLASHSNWLSSEKN